MIIVKVDETSRAVQLDGPHHPDQTRAIADAISQAMRMLNYATHHGDGLAYPADVSSVFAALAEALARLPQALGQMSGWIVGGSLTGRIQEDPETGPYSGDTAAAARALASVCIEAGHVANKLSGLLSEAQNKTANLAHVEPTVKP